MSTRGVAARAKRAAFEALPDRWQLPVRFRYLRATGLLEAEIDHLSDVVRPGLTVDVGANYGIYTYALARLGHRVLAIEPQPWCARAIRAWGAETVDVLEVGLSDEPREATLHLPITNGVRSTGYASLDHASSTEEPLTIRLVRLDDLELTDVSFIKIDVEGHELSVLEGSVATLHRCRPDLLIEIAEVNMSAGSVAAVFEWLANAGYQGRFLLEDRWQPLETFSIDLHQRAHAAGDLTAPSVNNFLFRPRVA